MITKITPYRPYQASNLSYANKPALIPFFGRQPVPVQDAIAEMALKVQSATSDIEIPFINPDRQSIILENLVLLGRKLRDGRTKIEFKYNNPGADGEVQIPANISDRNFLDSLISKLKYASSHLNDDGNRMNDF